jgi:hypothetical protein
MEIQYPEYFRVKAIMVILFICGLTSVDIKKYQHLISFTLNTCIQYSMQINYKRKEKKKRDI